MNFDTIGIILIVYLNTTFALLMKDSAKLLHIKPFESKLGRIIMLIPPCTLIVLIWWWFGQMYKYIVGYFKD